MTATVLVLQYCSFCSVGAAGKTMLRGTKAVFLKNLSSPIHNRDVEKRIVIWSSLSEILITIRYYIGRKCMWSYCRTNQLFVLYKIGTLIMLLDILEVLTKNCYESLTCVFFLFIYPAGKEDELPAIMWWCVSFQQVPVLIILSAMINKLGQLRE